MKILQSIKLDFGRSTLPVTVFAKRYDKESRYIEITPLNCGQPYTLEDGITPRLHLTKSDGHSVVNDCEIEDGVILAELTEQCLTAYGIATAEIGLYKDSALLSSQTFYVDVKKSAYDMSQVVSSDEYKSLVDALDRIDFAATAAELAVENAEAAEKVTLDAAAAAEEAVNNAKIATENAENAAEGAANIDIKATQTATGATIEVTSREGVKTEVHIDTLTAVNTWKDVQNAVRLGLGATLFPVGSEFTTHDTETGLDIVWVVRGHDNHSAVNKKLTHSMTLEAKRVYSGASGNYKQIQFDAAEALYYAENGLAAGTYNFTVQNQLWYTGDNGKTFQFTLTQDIPVGGQIKVATTYNKTFEGTTAKTHPSPDSSETIETFTITEGSAGTSLGTTDGTGNVNHLHRIVFGSSNYGQSAIRQWLNSDAAAGSVWSPTTKFDRPPLWETTLAGFMRGLPEDFLEVVQTANVPCRTNNVHEVNSLDGAGYITNADYSVLDKFFILSRPEVYGTYDGATIKDGNLLEYYDGLTDSERVKYDETGAARIVWLRSVYVTTSHGVRVVGSSGALNNIGADHRYGVAPACIIA